VLEGADLSGAILTPTRVGVKELQVIIFCFDRSSIALSSFHSSQYQLTRPALGQSVDTGLTDQETMIRRGNYTWMFFALASVWVSSNGRA
jgi:hypothetical protein